MLHGKSRKSILHEKELWRYKAQTETRLPTPRAKKEDYIVCHNFLCIL